MKRDKCLKQGFGFFILLPSHRKVCFCIALGHWGRGGGFCRERGAVSVVVWPRSVEGPSVPRVRRDPFVPWLPGVPLGHYALRLVGASFDGELLLRGGDLLHSGSLIRTSL